MAKRGDRGKSLVNHHRQIKLYVEGGGEHQRDLADSCRRGFSEFFGKMGFLKHPRIIACGTRRQAYEDFCTAVKQANSEDLIFLLVDSEDPVSGNSPWDHLYQRKEDRWRKPSGVSDEQAHLMVQCMEAWFLADRDALVKYFKKGFSQAALPAVARPIEEISRYEAYDSLKKSTKDRGKNVYEKGRDSFGILGLIDPQKVTIASAWAKRLEDTLRKNLGSK